MIELETRTCACGCPRTFRVLPTSNARHSSELCKEIDEQARALAAKNRNPKRGRPRVDTAGLLTIHELALAIKINTSTLYAWVKKGRIPCSRVGSERGGSLFRPALRFDLEAVRKVIAAGGLRPGPSPLHAVRKGKGAR